MYENMLACVSHWDEVMLEYLDRAVFGELAEQLQQERNNILRNPMTRDERRDYSQMVLHRVGKDVSLGMRMNFFREGPISRIKEVLEKIVFELVFFF
jgi:hypothetical protein